MKNNEVNSKDILSNESADNSLNVNSAANKIIYECKQRKIDYQKRILEHLLFCINKVCEDEKINYFAIGKLLTYFNEGEETYPDTNEYSIGMFRKDYEVFVKKIAVKAEEHGIMVLKIYDNMYHIKRNVFSLQENFSFNDELGRTNLSVCINVFPYDYLPENEDARKKYMKSVSKMANRYSGTSFYIKKIWKDAKLSRKVAKNIIFNKSYFKKSYNRFNKLLSIYQEQTDAKYCGRIQFEKSEPVRVEDIWPVEKVQFLNGSLQVPNNIEFFSYKKKDDYIDYIKQIRLKTLNKLDQFCKEQNITYFAIDELLKTCMKGVYEVRFENGEVQPWSVGLLRNEYEKLIRILKENHSDLILVEMQDQAQYVKALMNGVILKSDYVKDSTGSTYPIYIEVFDEMPEDFDEMIRYQDDIKKLRNIYYNSCKKELGLDYFKNKTTSKQAVENIHSYASQYNGVDCNKVCRTLIGNLNPIGVNDILPVQRKTLGEFEILVPHNPYCWSDINDENYTEYIAEKREKLLGIIDTICTKFDIPYFAMTKLLMATVVYHDTIPNYGHRAMEIGLLRADYIKLFSILREQGKDFGIQLFEFYDHANKYPATEPFVTFTGEEYSKYRIYIVPFDKIPESPYLRKAFIDKLQELNQEYCELIDFKMGNTSKYKELYSAEEIKKKKIYYKDKNALEMANEIIRFSQKYNDDPMAFSYERVSFRISRIIDKDDLFPLQREKFRGIEINRPNDYSIWQPVLNKELEFQVECIQKTDLIIMQEFDRVCQKLGIGYFVCGGTMLGYMRHQGFIPWDDDMDIGMLRADYDRFLNEAGSVLGEEYFLQTRETDPNIPYLFSKLRLNGTEYCTNYNVDRDFHKGICIDIFPFDYIPNDPNEREEFVREVIALSKEHQTIADNQLPEVEEPFPPRTEEEKRICMEQRELIRKYWDTSLVDSQKRYIDKATQYNSKAKELGLTTVASFVPSYTFIDVDNMLPYQRGKFENIEVSVLKRPDLFLTMQYGDYMQLPPLHMRVAHRLVRWSDGVNGADNRKIKNYDELMGEE